MRQLLVRKARTLKRLEPADRRLALIAIALLAVAKIVLGMFSVQQLIRLNRWNVRRVVHRSSSPRQVAWAVRLASRYVARANCLPQALATQMLLSWHGHSSRLHIGVNLAETFRAHAWVECDGELVADG